MDPVVEIEFDCLPLRSIARIDVPLDASAAFRARCERLQQAIDRYDRKNAYFLFNTQCVYRLANSEFTNVLRFTFDGTLLTDSGDSKADHADLDIRLVAETCGGVPPEVLGWLRGVVRRAVMVEFDRFIMDGQLAARVQALGEAEGVVSVGSFAGMDV